MKKQLGLIASLSLIAGTALAADLPSRKVAVIDPPPPMWTGAYAGLNMGYSVGTSNGSYTSAFPVIDNWDNAQTFAKIIPYFDYSQGIILGNSGNANMTQNGVIGGGQIGYNLQLQDKYVVGFEADFQGTGITGSGKSYNFAKGELDYRTKGGGVTDYYSRYVYGTNSISGSVNWLGTARFRAGYLITPTLLGYATGGLTYGEISASSNPGALAVYYRDTNPPVQRGYQGSVGYNGTASSLAVGWNAGGGFEWMFMPNWSVKTEAIYYNLGSQTVTSYTYAPAYGLVAPGFVTPTPTGDWMTQNKNTLSYNGIIARAGVNYHFNLGSLPVIGKL